MLSSLRSGFTLERVRAASSRPQRKGLRRPRTKCNSSNLDGRTIEKTNSYEKRPTRPVSRSTLDFAYPPRGVSRCGTPSAAFSGLCVPRDGFEPGLAIQTGVWVSGPDRSGLNYALKCAFPTRARLASQTCFFFPPPGVNERVGPEA